MTAIEFLRKFSSGHRIVSSNDLTQFQISEAQSLDKFFIDAETGYGWAALPWTLTTDQDRARERSFFAKNGLGQT